MINKIKLFLAFLYKFVLNRFKGLPIYSSKDTVEHRLQTCTFCPYRADKICMSCGCFIKAKIKFQDSECPNKYWRK